VESGGSEIKLQIGRRETPTLPTERRPQIEQSYFRVLPFVPAQIVCLALAEIVAEKIRACYQRDKARDIYDLGVFATRPLDQALIRRLVVLKLWQAHDTFDPARLMQKFEDGRDFDRQLLNRAVIIDRERITADCVRGFRFLADLTEDEQILARDKYQREQAVAERLRASLGC
jgi:predicted nucleotidyltransferase component of viral defense system